MPWSDAFLKVLKDNDVQLVSYVPDNLLTPLTNGVASDNYFMSICATREDEAVGLAAGAADIVAVAKGAGIANSQWIQDEDHFERLLDRRFDDRGPVLLAAKIDDKAAPIQTPRDPTLIRIRFMQGMGTSKGGALDA